MRDHADTIFNRAAVPFVLVFTSTAGALSSQPERAEADTEDYWDGNWHGSSLSGAFLLEGDIRKGNWGLFGDIDWIKLSNEYYADVGAGDSDNTYQINIGVGYAFHWGDIALTYRDIKYEQGSNDKFLKKAEISGPSFNYTWHF